MLRFALGRGRLLRVETLDHFLNRHLVALAYLLQDFRRGSLNFLDFQTAQEPNVIDYPLITRVRRRDAERAVAQFKRQDAVTFDELDREDADRLGRYGESGQAGQPFR